jgi:hypothetical protein
VVSIAVDRESEVLDWTEMAQWFLAWVDECHLLKASARCWFSSRAHKIGDCRAAVLPPPKKKKERKKADFVGRLDPVV